MSRLAANFQPLERKPKNQKQRYPFSFTFELNDYWDGRKKGVFHGTLNTKISCIARRRLSGQMVVMNRNEKRHVRSGGVRQTDRV